MPLLGVGVRFLRPSGVRTQIADASPSTSIPDHDTGEDQLIVAATMKVWLGEKSIDVGRDTASCPDEMCHWAFIDATKNGSHRNTTRSYRERHGD